MRKSTPHACDAQTLKEHIAKVTEEYGEVIVAFRNFGWQLERNQQISDAYKRTDKDAEKLCKRQIALELTSLKTACESAIYALKNNKKEWWDSLQDKVSQRNSRKKISRERKTEHG